MRICVSCEAPLQREDFGCAACGHAPARIGQFLAFAPEMAYSNDGFDPGYFAELARIEAKNFWFRSRNRLITWAINRYFPTARNLLEFGCGTGFVLAGIRSAFPHLVLSGSEIYRAGLGFAAERVPGAHFYQMDARRVPFAEEFDLTAAFDVLEHIEDDGTVLRQMWQATRQGGGLILTVPQHPGLWSKQDEFACHRRRYRASELKQKVSDAGFELVRVSSFLSLLLPLMIGVRLAKRRSTTQYDGMAELRIHGLANLLCERVMDLERLLIRAGGSFPAGGSLLLVARKR